jgi:TetR/AcrR family transcriptional repressor of nem operon
MTRHAGQLAHAPRCRRTHRRGATSEIRLTSDPLIGTMSNRHAHRDPDRRRQMIDDGASAPSLTPRGRATHARIVGAAADLVYSQGLNNTTTLEVRKAASVSGSQLTHYFKDKRAIVRGVIALRRNELVAFHTSGQLARLDSLEGLQTWADLNVAYQNQRNCVGGCMFGSLAGELVPSDDDILVDLSKVYDEWIALFRSALAAMRKRGELRPEADPMHLARVLVAAHQGGSLVTQTTRSVKPLRDVLNAAVQYVYSFAAESVITAQRNDRRSAPTR